ncbi:MAG: hypothetical protein RLZZ212_1040 [Actinomycetota bacterium]
MEDLLLALGDLPLHPLVVHFAVILFPISLLFLIAVVMVARLRSKHLLKAIVAVALTTPFVFLAQQSGEALSEVLYEPEPHAEYGEMLMPLALATLLVSVVFWWSLRGPKIFSQLLAVALISLAFAGIAMTVVVGHSGAAATWSGVLP